MTATSKWAGRLSLGRGIVCYLGPGSNAQRHRHDAIQVIWSPQSTFDVTLGETTSTVHLAMIPSRTDHLISADSTDITLLLVEPSGATGRRLNDLARTISNTELTNRVKQMVLPDNPSSAELTNWGRQLVGKILGEPPPHRPEVRPEAVAASRYIDEHLLTTPLLTDTAQHVGLSARQLRRTFALEIGMPYRRYVLWRRFRQVVLAYADGDDLTTAAARTGFADSAHLSRTFRQTFGLSPSEVLPFVSVVESDFPGR